MDTDTLKSVLSLLIWGAVFFLVMRYGCGAHVMGGHGHRGHHRGTPDYEARDPVCGMPVKDEASAAAAAHRGRTYYFCSHSCRDKFEANPDQYAEGTSGGPHHA